MSLHCHFQTKLRFFDNYYLVIKLQHQVPPPPPFIVTGGRQLRYENSNRQSELVTI